MRVGLRRFRRYIDDYAIVLDSTQALGALIGVAFLMAFAGVLGAAILVAALVAVVSVITGKG